MRWAAVGVGLGILVVVGVGLAVVLRRRGAPYDTDELDPLFVPGIATVGVGAALLSPLGAFAIVMIGVGGLLLIVALTRMRGDGGHRT